MKEKTHFPITLFLLLCFLGGAFILQADAHTEKSEIIFIANTSVNESTLTQKDLQKIFLGRKSTWENKDKITFAIFDHEIAYPLFLETIGKTSSQFSQYWKRQVFTGKGKDPLQIESLEELIEYVANTEGAISFVIEPVSNENIKTISITD